MQRRLCRTPPSLPSICELVYDILETLSTLLSVVKLEAETLLPLLRKCVACLGKEGMVIFQAKTAGTSNIVKVVPKFVQDA